MVENESPEIRRLRENLETLRKLFGWSAETLGKKLDMKRQSVLNLEQGKVKMSRVQYIAIRAIFENELSKKNKEEQENLRAIMMLVFDDDNIPIEEEQKEQALITAKAVSNTSQKKKDREVALKSLGITLGAIGVSAAVLLALKQTDLKSGFADWLDDITNK